MEMFTCIGTYDFSGYNMKRIIDNEWSHCHINSGAITYDEYVYTANSIDERQKKGVGVFFWPEAKHASQDTKVLDLDSNLDHVVLETVKVEQMPATTSLISVGREPKRKKFYECGTWFIIRPAHSSREFSVFAEERKATKYSIKHMAFVSNDFVLTQFCKMP